MTLLSAALTSALALGKVAIPAGATHAKVVVEGDGQMYKLALSMDPSAFARAPSFGHDFLTKKGAVSEHFLPLSEFIPTFRGQPVPGAVLRLEDVRCLSMLLSLKASDGSPNSHFGDGPFRLVVHEIAFVRK